MMLSRKPAVLLVAVIALGIIGVLGGVSASLSNTDNRNDNEGRTLTVVAKTVGAKVVDLGSQGANHGDLRVVNAPLYNESAKEKVGRLDFFCVTIDPADESAEKAHMAQWAYRYTLPGGKSAHKA